MAIHINDLILPEDRILFGCTLKNFAIDFGDQEDTYTATIIKEPGQIFTLESSGLNTGPFIMTNVHIVDTELISILQSWEEVVADINGTGVFNVVMKIPGNFFTQTINIITDLNIESHIINGTTLRIPINTEEKNVSGVRVTEIFDDLNNFTFFINNIDVRFDFTNIRSSLVNLSDYRIQNLNYTLSDVLNQLSLDYSIQYSFKPSFVNNILIISIETNAEDEINISDLNGAESAFDYILNNQSDKIVNLIEGFESNGITRDTPSQNDLISYVGGFKQEIVNVTKLNQFWGFDKDNNLLTSPTVFIDDDLDRKKIISISLLEQLLTGETNILTDTIDKRLILEAIKLKDSFWGIKFVVDEDEFLNEFDYNFSSLQPTELGWSDTDLSVGNFIKSRRLLQSSDGRFKSFIRVPSNIEFDKIIEFGPPGFGHETIVQSTKLDEGIFASDHVAFNLVYGIIMETAQVERINGYTILTLPIPLQFTISIDKTGIISTHDEKITRMSHIDSAFLAVLNPQKRYGPFNFYQGKIVNDNDTSVLNNININKFNIVDNELVPWNFSNGSSNNTDAIDNTNDYLKKQETSHKSPISSLIFKTGSVEVADLPLEKILLKRKFPYGIAVDRVSISFGIDGFKTIYKLGISQKSDSPNNINNRDKFSRANLAKRLGAIEERIDHFIPKVNNRSRKGQPKSLDELMDKKINEKIEPIQKELSDKKKSGEQELHLGAKDMEYVYKKPEGGQGVIVGVEIGPFYTVRRVNYADIDSQTFAGGINITESYFLAEWQHVRNLSEDEDSPGYLLPGTKVNVSIFSESEFGPFVPYIEHSPEVFSPPKNT